MTILYSNGCSYTANNLIERNQRYPLLVGNHYGWEVVDRAQSGACNDRITRCTMRDCINLLPEKQDIIALVQLTHPARTECSVALEEKHHWKYWNDENFASIKPAEPDLPSDVDDYLRLHAMMFDKQSSMIKLFVSVIGLTAFFKKHSIRYLIFNGHEELKLFEPEVFYDYLKSDPGVIDLKKFDMLSLTGTQDHPDQMGMIRIADYFIDLLKDYK